MASTLIGGMATAAPAMAQDDDIVVITGTRIQRTDTVAPSPITSVDEEMFELNNVVNTEDLLNTLPQLIPAFDATSNNPGNGTATVSLRGLGTTRTLVLVDGSRFVGSGAAQVVDLNNIPAAMVERVDVVTGGASAVYGSDAVAGVVNFILRDDFEGVEVSASHEFSLDEGDAAISDVSITVGGNFDNGRGNATLSYGYTNREAVFQASREFSQQAFWSPGPGNSPYIPGGSSNIPGTLIIAGGVPNVMTDTSGNPVPWSPYNYAPTNYLQLPQERHMISGFATYEINDHIEFYSRGIFANNVVDSQLAPTPTGGITVTVNTDTNPWISPALRTHLQGATSYDPVTGTNTLTVARRMQEFGTRNSLRDTNTFQGLFGLRGDINDDWSYDVFYNYSRSAISQIQSGNISVSAFQQAVFCDPSNTDASCAGVPGMNIWNGPDSINTQSNAQDLIDYVRRTGAQIDVVEATQAVATLSGELSNMASPMADVAPALVLGVEYRENTADIRPDSVLGPDVRGFNQSLAIGGGFDVYEFFTEVDVPLITNRPGIESFSFNGAFRMSDYSTVGTTQTYAGGFGWEPVEDLRFRAQYNRAVRAPNVGDLFAPATNGFPGAQDPCSGGLGSYSSATNDATCIAHGVTTPGASFQLNAQIEALFGGNANVEEEVADTFTIGAVWQPSFISGLTVQVDYYDIQIEDAIATPSLQNLLDECYLQDIAASCTYFASNRGPSGAISPAPALYVANIAVLDAEGVDLRADYMWDAEQMGLSSDLGSFAVNYYATFTIASGYQNSPSAAYVNCEGIFGGACGEPTPEYKHVMQASWYWGALTTALRWRHVGGVDYDDPASVSNAEQAIDAYNYFDVTFGYDLSETARVSVGIQNLTDEEPPVLTSTTSEQANTWPATYDPFGRRLFLGANLRF
eukprot:TRINITY_DN10341_c0_g1_i1.p1 TRINITY_DN10341_c0_g1~~TRINITY_DN10341_c0_g1_i1.p1  ORF type:complete len:917 (-),score=157.62 TRINITY_DN10341_c0_g1_i1:26-2776(-)